MVVATDLNTHIRDNLLVLSTHAHSGAGGMGSSTLSGISLSALAVPVLADQSGNPSTAGRLQRNGNNLVYYGAALVGLYADAVAGTASGTISESSPPTLTPERRGWVEQLCPA
jgi:hypothetical protein